MGLLAILTRCALPSPSLNPKVITVQVNPHGGGAMIGCIREHVLIFSTPNSTKPHLVGLQFGDPPSIEVDHGIDQIA